MENEVPLSTKVLELLQNGKDNAIFRRDLCKKLNKKEREVRLAIEELRHEGWQIVTSGQGYFIAETNEELQEFIDYMRSRIREECIMLREVRLATKRKITKEVQLPLLIK
jgi:biotin operon repressor